MLSRPSQGLLLLAALTAGVISTSSPAVAASIETAPCAKLASGEVKFAAGNASCVTAPEPKPTVQTPSNAPESSAAAAAPTVPGVEAGSKPDRTTQSDVESTTKIVAIAVLVLVTLLPLLAYRDKKKRARHRA